MPAPIDHTQPLKDARTYAFSVAYRMIGSVAEAEDVAQEALMRFHDAHATGDIRRPKALLATIATRLSLNALRAARRRRENYYGVWLPEPLAGGTSEESGIGAADYDAVSYAFLVMLEQLSPFERAVVLLKDVYGYQHDDIATMLERKAENCRKALSRARKRLRAQKQPVAAHRQEKQVLLERLVAALRDGDLQATLTLLKDDAVMLTDGGGEAPATGKPLYGGELIARFMACTLKLLPDGASSSIEEVHGGPALVVRAQGQIIFLLMCHIEDAQFATLYGITSPDKLASLN